MQPASANWFSPETGAIAAKTSAAWQARRCDIAAPFEKPLAKTRFGSIVMRVATSATSARRYAMSSMPLVQAAPLTQM